ncbi:MAG: leucine-rich repeat domain-containing protein [Defluviitaleaceae bacterium]|nr:leucine-rich repeat domain-containing protein [Defluviitaleaceae bacterium]
MKKVKVILTISLIAAMVISGCSNGNSDDISFPINDDNRPWRFEQANVDPNYIFFGIRMFSKDTTKIDLSTVLPDWGFNDQSIAYEIAKLRHMTNLTELRLWNSQIRDISPLSELKNLTTLSLGSNQISDLTPLSGLTNLTHLALYGNQISDLTPLANLTNLTYLTLFDNQVNDLAPLSDLKNLTILELHSNQISDLTSLTDLTNLKQLTLDNNQITDITPLYNLINLEYVSLSGNPTHETPSTITNNTALGSISTEVDEIFEFGGLNWIVLEKVDNYAMIISQNLHMMGLGQFNNRSGQAWEISTLRSYLNGEFFHRFSPAERMRIRETQVVNSRNPWFNIMGGGDTIDKIFVLSIEEVIHYFGDSGQLENRPDSSVTVISDEFNDARRVTFEDGTYRWQWLRSPGGMIDLAAGIDGAGNIAVSGSGVNNASPGVRPVMWINLDSLL